MVVCTIQVVRGQVRVDGLVGVLPGRGWAIEGSVNRYQVRGGWCFHVGLALGDHGGGQSRAHIAVAAQVPCGFLAHVEVI